MNIYPELEESFEAFGISNPWWINNKDEKYWFETINVDNEKRQFDNEDKKKIKLTIGERLYAPHFIANSSTRKTKKKRRSPNHTLVNFVKKGDVVFHYVSDQKAIIGYSIAKSNSYNGLEYWGSDVDEERLAYIVNLRGLIRFQNPITLEDIKIKHKEFLQYIDFYEKAIYAPFGHSPNIMNEGYLFKFPKEFIKILNLELNMKKNSYSSKNKTNKFIRSRKQELKEINIILEIIENDFISKNPESNKKLSSKFKARKQNTRPELELCSRFQEYINNIGIEMKFLSIGNYVNDIYIKDKDLMIEAKSSISAPDIRMVIGQIKHYDYLLKKDNRKPTYVSALFPEKPSNDFMRILSKEDIFVIWENEDGTFNNNLPGKFFYE